MAAFGRPLTDLGSAVVLLPSSGAAKVQVVLARGVSLVVCMHSIWQALTVLCRPDVHFHCDVNYDPFLFMEDHNKTYCEHPLPPLHLVQLTSPRAAFTITMYEFRATIPTLWDAVKEFTAAHPQYVAPDNALGYMSDDGGRTFNLCHFWSNFEIADMDFWRGAAYEAFFEHLDRKGGFYYEVRALPPLSLSRPFFPPPSPQSPATERRHS